MCFCAEGLKNRRKDDSRGIGSEEGGNSTERKTSTLEQEVKLETETHKGTIISKSLLQTRFRKRVVLIKKGGRRRIRNVSDSVTVQVMSECMIRMGKGKILHSTSPGKSACRKGTHEFVDPKHKWQKQNFTLNGDREEIQSDSGAIWYKGVGEKRVRHRESMGGSKSLFPGGTS